MPEKYEQLLVRTDTFEPFVLCLALGTLEAMKSKIWTTEAGVWTIGRPTFLNKLEEMKVSGETMDVLVQFDELNALEKFVEKEAFYNEILKIEQIIKNRLKNFSKDFWYAKWTDQAS